MIKRLIILILLVFPPIGRAFEEVVKIQELLSDAQFLNHNEKVSFLSAYFVGKNSRLGPLGEVNYDIFDRDPLYSFSDFDCTTFVETIMALSLSKDMDDFYSNIIKIRYEYGKISFKSRNHFISLDWIPNNTALGLLKDITDQISPSEESSALIDKKNWYKKLTLSNISREDLSEEEKFTLLKQLRSLGENFIPTLAKIRYIEFTSIYDNPLILNSIPNGSIISIVKPNWDLTESIGTHLNVSHQGLAIWKDGALFYRHASLQFGKVMDTPMLQFLYKYKENSGNGGINIQKILAK